MNPTQSNAPLSALRNFSLALALGLACAASVLAGCQGAGGKKGDSSAPQLGAHGDTTAPAMEASQDAKPASSGYVE
ncbi:MAG: hypothetical protein AAF823_09400 [Planctomycetota bacterium]